jgi:hypothetical protein
MIAKYRVTFYQPDHDLTTKIELVSGSEQNAEAFAHGIFPSAKRGNWRTEKIELIKKLSE